MLFDVQSVTVRNFLSYGNVPQTFDLKSGINFIVGKDINTGRSNAVGKSSILFSIPFALFGKFNSVKKEDIPHWKNKKNCSVTLVFSINDKLYKIVRCIKPDKLEIYENDVLLPQPPDIRTYQKQLEENILKMDYNTFMYLFYTNLNTSIPLLKMSTIQKRTFLEKLFVLDTYTELNNKLNEKLKLIEGDIFKNELTIENNNKMIDNLVNQNNELCSKNLDITELESKLQKTKDELNETDKISTTTKVTTDDIDKIKEKISSCKVQLKQVETNITNAQKNQKSILKIINDKKDKERDRLSKIQQTEKLLEDITVTPTEETDTYIYGLEQSIERNTLIKTDITSQIATNKEKLSSVEKSYNNLKSGVCPLCNQQISKDTINDYEETGTNLKSEIQTLTESLTEVEKTLDESKRTLKNLKDKRTKNIEKQRKFDEYSTILKTLKNIEPSSYEEDESTLEQYKNDIIILTSDMDDYKLSLDLFNKQLNDITDTYESQLKKQKYIDLLEKSIIDIENEISIRKQNIEEIQSIVNKNNIIIDDTKKLTESVKSSIKKKTELKDYLSYLKLLCKDENVKQYAISSYIVYLTQQVNFYLSKAGSSHYVKFDKWLNESIYSLGVGEVPYSSLSGGESRSIDLSIQFAFLDVVRLKNGIFPNILLLDEILDSSIDSGGLNNILNIIRTKQSEEDSKIFIITHRQDIHDIESDRIYQVIKEDGFSRIEKL